ncbi:uncharacterized protein TNCV_1926471 [Trichonephila clavipes]|nr:uncharacterized protein TNCV_1926471 [Trichonephila clavipes]
MPWKVDRAFLTDNYELCLKRLESTIRKLEKIGFREKYHEVFREWLAEGVIEEIPGKELPVRTHYLPHRPVIKETSATSVANYKRRNVHNYIETKGVCIRAN